MIQAFTKVVRSLCAMIMIAKLCTWAPDRAKTIEQMRIADRFEVESIGHNLPFLSAVMDHKKFISGKITTAFIAEVFRRLMVLI